VLNAIEPVAPLFQLYNGGPVPEERFTRAVAEFGAPRRRLDPGRFYSELRNGATLVINRFESYSLRALRLCNHVGRFAAAQTVGNAYLSLGGRGTFGKHWDTHDVFALQLIGRKRWQVFAPTFPLPLGMHTSERSGHACPPTPALDVVLEAGDLLYVPRGWWHHAIAFDEPSLHFSIGTYAPTLHDYLTWVCARCLPAIESARSSWSADLSRDALAAALAALSEAALASSSRVEFERNVEQSVAQRADIDTALFLSAAQGALAPQTTVRLAARGRASIGQTEVAVDGGRIRLHPLCRSIVALLAEGELALAEVAARLRNESSDAVSAAVLELARYEIVAIERG
jgi:ribosomal protein L16 Arg81 hydroxylase